MFDEVTFLIGSRRLDAEAIRNELIEFINVSRYYEERLSKQQQCEEVEVERGSFSRLSLLNSRVQSLERFEVAKAIKNTTISVASRPLS